VNFELTQDQKEIQALTRDFAKAEIEPHAAEWDREHKFPRDLFAKLAELGVRLCPTNAAAARLAAALAAGS